MSLITSYTPFCSKCQQTPHCSLKRKYFSPTWTQNDKGLPAASLVRLLFTSAPHDPYEWQSSGGTEIVSLYYLCTQILSPPRTHFFSGSNLLLGGMDAYPPHLKNTCLNLLSSQHPLRSFTGVIISIGGWKWTGRWGRRTLRGFTTTTNMSPCYKVPGTLQQWK